MCSCAYPFPSRALGAQSTRSVRQLPSDKAVLVPISYPVQMTLLLNSTLTTLMLTYLRLTRHGGPRLSDPEARVQTDRCQHQEKIHLLENGLKVLKMAF